MKTVLIAFLLLAGLVFPAQAEEEKPDYRRMIERIEEMLTAGAADYRAGNVEAAKANVQNSYFQVFEALEGPIRINISARRAYALEREFGAIRKLMTQGAPSQEVEQRIAAHVKDLDTVIPVLEQGAVLVATKTASLPSDQAPAAAPAGVEPAWRDVVARIEADLAAAAAAHDKGDAVAAKAALTRALFDGYKNSEITIAVRRHVSQQKNAEIEGDLSRIGDMIAAKAPSADIRAASAQVVAKLNAILPGLPLMGAVAEKAKDEPAPIAQSDWAAVAAAVDANVGRALAMVKAGNGNGAIDLLQNTYFDVFEGSGMEARIGGRDPAFKAQLEAYFSKLMALAASPASADAFATEGKALSAGLAQAVAMLSAENASDPASLFVYALLILLREGFEAMLIVTALCTYLVKTGNSDKLKVIGNSVVVALIASVATAIILKLVIAESAVSQEIMEGGTMLLAALVLFSVSYWMISKSEAQAWNEYIKGKVDTSLSSGSLKALWFTSFLAVYREGAETVLFYQALTSDASGTGLLAVAGGFAVGCVALAVLYWVMKSGAMRLPIRAFFQVTGGLLYLMSFVFVGQGVMELVEGKLFTPALVPWKIEFPLLGIYPYWQSLVPQFLLIVAALVALVALMRQRAGAKAKSASA